MNSEGFFLIPGDSFCINTRHKYWLRNDIGRDTPVNSPTTGLQLRWPFRLLTNTPILLVPKTWKEYTLGPLQG